MTVKEQPIQPTGTEIGTTMGHLFDLGAYLRGAAQTADRDVQERMDGLLRSTPAGVHIVAGFDSAPSVYKAWKRYMEKTHGGDATGGAIAAMVTFDHQRFPDTPAFDPVKGGEGEGVSLGSDVLHAFGLRVGMAMLRVQDGAAGRLFDPGQGMSMITGMVGEFRAQYTSDPSTLRAIDAALTGFLGGQYV